MFSTIVIAVLVFILGKRGDASNRTALILTLKAAGILSGSFAVYHLVRTPWKLHQALVNELHETKGLLAIKEKELEKRLREHEILETDLNGAKDALANKEKELGELLGESSDVPTSTDPQINIAFHPEPLPIPVQDHFIGERPVILTNDGGTAAIDVHIDDVVLSQGRATFPDVGLIKSGDRITLRPDIRGVNGTEGPFAISEFESLLQIEAPLFDPFSVPVKINYTDTNREHSFITEATVAYGAGQITRVSTVSYLKEPIKCPLVRIWFVFERNGCAYLYVKNHGVVADVFASLRVTGCISDVGNVHARWEHTSDVITRIPGGMERRLLLAQLRYTRDSLMTSQWEVFFNRDGVGVGSAHAVYSSVVGHSEAQAPDIVLDVTVASDPDMRGGVQSKRIVLHSNRALEST